MRSLHIIALAGIIASVACGRSDQTGDGTNQDSNNTGVGIGPGNSGDGNNSTLPTPNGATTRIMGRVQNTDPNGPIFCWPGTRLYAGFTGTSLSVNLKEPDVEMYNGVETDNAFDVYIDGNTTPTVIQLDHNNTTYQVAKNLQDGNHQITLSKRTECDMGAVQYLGFTPASGEKLIPADSPHTRRIEFVGDSGTAGYGADGNVTLDNMCSFTPQTEEADVSYALQTGKFLAADVHDTAYSGKGIYQNRDVVGDPVLTLPRLWTQQLGDTDFQAQTWDTNQWVPQAVVVIVGGNDFAASTPDATKYNTTATTFLKAIRTAYGKDCQIFVAVSPMIRGTFVAASDPQNVRGPAEQYAQAMVTTLTGGGDSNVHYIALPEDDGSRNWGCDQHLTVASGQYYGQMIAKAVAQQTGWSVSQ